MSDDKDKPAPAASDQPQPLPPGVTPEMAKWMSPQEVRDWPSMSRIQRLNLLRKFQNDGANDRPTLADEIKLRHGADASIDKLSVGERLRLAHQTSMPAPRPDRVSITDLAPQNRQFLGAAKLQLLDVHREINQLNIERSMLLDKKGLSFNLEVARDNRVRTIEQRLSFLRQRHGLVAA